MQIVFLWQREYTKEMQAQTGSDHYPQEGDKTTTCKLTTKWLQLLSHNINQGQQEPEGERAFWSQWQWLCLHRDHSLKPTRNVFSPGHPLTSQTPTLLVVHGCQSSLVLPFYTLKPELANLGHQILEDPYFLVGMLPKLNLRISIRLWVFDVVVVLFLELSKLFSVLHLDLEIGLPSWITCVFRVSVIFNPRPHHHAIQYVSSLFLYDLFYLSFILHFYWGVGSNHGRESSMQAG